MDRRALQHATAAENVARALDTHLEMGLSSQEARLRLERYGYNELQERKRPGVLRLLLGQFDSFLVIVLIVAAAISLLLGEEIDAIAIMAIVVLNAVLGVVQESRAEQALAALKKMAAPMARVVRDGVQVAIPSRELVPGDIVMLDAGNYVPADMRLVESVNLRIDESSLTGESAAVDKDARAVLDADIPLGDRRNSAFMGTTVTYGRGRGLVTATGMHTQIGMIAEMIQSYEEEPTPLQRKLNQLGKTLGVAALALCGVIFLLGLLRDTAPWTSLSLGWRAYLAAHRSSIVDLFVTSVSLAVAAVPEGLPAVVTICLALGMQRMVSRHALIRKLPAVETLGCATVICSDKTGTLTQNEMTVVRGWSAGRSFQVTGEGYSPTGEFLRDGQPFDPLAEPAVALLLHGALLCNDALLAESGIGAGDRTWRMIGDPTEGAMVAAAAKAGLWRREAEACMPRLAEIPFDSERKSMTTVHSIENCRSPSSPFAPVADLLSSLVEGGASHERAGYVAFVKGAPDVVLQRCHSVLTDGRPQPLTHAERHDILAANQEMARQALRVLGVAFKPLSQLPTSITPDSLEQDLTFLGLLGMIDPARPEVKEAVKIAQGAGLKTVMVTGDYKDTAVAIASEIGLLSPGGMVLTGSELEAMSDEDLAEVAERVDAYARVSPHHKSKIVNALKQRGHVVAMTGDGVNDAPALRRADIGVAMGITGTDVTKETADMVLTDDNYASIIAAIEEGRNIYSNIRKFVFYLVSCNVGEILIIFLAMLAGLPIPLRAVQLLWLNLVTDGAPALALGLEKGDPDVMKRPPRPTNEPVINREMVIGVAVQAVVMSAAVLSAFLYGLRRFPGNLAGAQTVAFATLVVSELFRAYTARSERHSVVSIGILGNRYMQYAVGSSLLLLLAVIYLPFLRQFFGTVPLTLSDWLIMLPLMLLASVAAEITKLFLRRGAGTAARLRVAG